MGFNRGQALISAMDLSRRATKVLLSSIKSQKDLSRNQSYTANTYRQFCSLTYLAADHLLPIIPIY